MELDFVGNTDEAVRKINIQDASTTVASFFGNGSVLFNAGSLTGGFELATTGAVTLGPATYPTIYHKIHGSVQHFFTSAQTGFEVKTDTNAGTAVTYFNFIRADGGNCGEIVVNTSAQTTSYSTSSDARLKIDQGEFSALSLISQVEPKRFKWKHNETLSPEIGFYAQELKEVAPWAVVEHENPEEMLGVDYGKVTGILWKAIKEQQAIIEAKEARIQQLESTLASVLARLEALENK
jgi:hypothetical protein